MLFSGVASLLWATGNLGAAQLVIAALIVAAGLESFFAICLGCMMFSVLMRLGVIHEDICEECSNIHLRSAAKPQ